MIDAKMAAALGSAALEGAVGLVVMDGECALCSGTARRIARMDRRNQIRICTVQSALGRRICAAHGMDPDDPESWLYLEKGRAYQNIEGTIALGRRLGGVGRLAVVLVVLPRSAREWLYRRVARNRYRLFGRANLCATPDPEVRRRLVE
ncbi:MAG: DCC1-like thiol-disulfide oxidoreductase family protein [Neomegalonema sp.]|nr:DCC1-like thiol-disulfide oxidoreductase family protein [Neomegalonema sp.]